MPARDKVKLGTIEANQSTTQYPHGTLNHRLGHMTAFAVAAALFVILAREEYAPWKAALPAFLFGLVLETIEPMVLDTPFEWWDVRDDAIGVGLVIFAYEVYRARKTRRPSG